MLGTQLQGNKGTNCPVVTRSPLKKGVERSLS